jgi:hypothetical protein
MLSSIRPSFELLDWHRAIIAKACPNTESFGQAWKAYLNTHRLTEDHFQAEQLKRALNKKN